MEEGGAHLRRLAVRCLPDFLSGALEVSGVPGYSAKAEGAAGLEVWRFGGFGGRGGGGWIAHLPGFPVR